ncbi:MAG: hypothetical protein HOQ29_09455, partial [Acidobacteria bacterium]|nr:hypothetical protein [Acidobacteriota bacterium]
SLLGLAASLDRGGERTEARTAIARAAAATDALRRGGRRSEATLAEAFAHAVGGRPDAAIAALHRLLDEADLPFTGWTAPIEPLLDPLRGYAGFADVLKMLRDRSG